MNFIGIDKKELIRIISSMKNGGEKMSETPIYKLCKKMSALRNKPTLTLIIHNSLGQSHILDVHKIVRKRKFEELDLILHSSGGQVSAAYQILELIKTHSEHLTIFIPIYAKSAATIFVLGCSKIIMSELAELGPLDTQVLERKEGSLEYTSALNPFKTIEELQRFALRMFDQSVRLLLSRADYSVEEAVKHSMDFAARVTAPMFSQIRVEKMGEYSRALQIGLEYGRRLLKRYGKISEDNHDIILKKLIYGYPSHDYIIDYKEMKDIGFDVELPSDEEAEILHEIVLALAEDKRSEDQKDEINLIEKVVANEGIQEVLGDKKGISPQ